MDKITFDEIRQALLRSGYLLENRVLDFFIDNLYWAESNHRYKIDEIEGKFQEIDVIATTPLNNFSIGKSNISLYIHFFIECVNNPVPLALFQSHGDREKPATDWSYAFLNGSTEFLEMCSQHFPYSILEYQNLIIEKKSARQYCGFSEKKDKNVANRWMANHPDDFHQTLNKLAQFVKHKREESKERWDGVQPEYTRLEVFIPLIVLQGDIIEISNNKDLQLKNVQYYRLKTPYEKNYNVSLSVDIITESFLPVYLELKTNGLNKMFEDLKVFLENNIE